MFSFDSKDAVNLQGMRILGNSELTLDQLSSLITVCVLPPLNSKPGADERIQDGERHAREVYHSLTAKLKDEDLRRNEKAREKFAKR